VIKPGGAFGLIKSGACSVTVGTSPNDEKPKISQVNSPLPMNFLNSGSSGHLSADIGGNIGQNEVDMDLMIGHSPPGGAGNKLLIDGPFSGMGGGFYTSRPVTSGGAFPRRNQHYHAQ
jgi:hypothetical protein